MKPEENHSQTQAKVIRYVANRGFLFSEIEHHFKIVGFLLILHGENCIINEYSIS